MKFRILSRMVLILSMMISMIGITPARAGAQCTEQDLTITREWSWTCVSLTEGQGIWFEGEGKSVYFEQLATSQLPFIISDERANEVVPGLFRHIEKTQTNGPGADYISQGDGTVSFAFRTFDEPLKVRVIKLYPYP